MGPGKRWDLDTGVCSARRHFCGQRFILIGKCEVFGQGLVVTADMSLRSNMTLKPYYVPDIPGPMEVGLQMSDEENLGKRTKKRDAKLAL